MPDCRILGVVQRDRPKPLVLYLKEVLAATDEVLAMAAPLKPTDVFRLAATCAEEGCPHFDGADCRLARRVVQLLPRAVDQLPPCNIRKDCRWHAQEGRDACLRCPEISTVNYDGSEITRAVAGLPMMIDS